MVLIRHNSEGPYTAYYRHVDGNPTSLGVDIVEAMLKATGQNLDSAETEKFIANEAGAGSEGKSVLKPEDAFLKLQGDLEWVYCISLGTYRSLEIYKTSCPRWLPDFAFSCLWSYEQYFDNAFQEGVDVRFKHLEETCGITLKALEAYHLAAESVQSKP